MLLRLTGNCRLAQTVEHSIAATLPFLLGSGFPSAGIAVLLGWSIGLTALGALGYRRATANSTR